MKFLVRYALSFIGTNYLWGGNNAIQGFDCSGLVQEILASVGMDPVGRDTAQSLRNHFIDNGYIIPTPRSGALCFYGGGPDKITHIAFCIDDMRVVEAGGGGSKTVSKEVAAATSAEVRIRPYNHRKDIVNVIMPSYPSWVEREPVCKNSL